MPRPFAIDPSEWPKIIKRLDNGEGQQALAEEYEVSKATIQKVVARSAEGQPKAANGKSKAKARANGATRKLLTQEASNEIVMPKIMEWISAFYKAQNDPADLPRLKRANAAIVLLAADIQAEL